MTKPFRLKHIDGAPLLTPGAPDDQVRNLGEAIRLLDSEPVIVVNLDNMPFSDVVSACREMLFAKRPDAAIVVVDPTHTVRVPLSHDGPTGVKVVDSIVAAAVSAQRVQRAYGHRAGSASGRRRRYRVVRSIS
jgi:hypothetical protein